MRRTLAVTALTVAVAAPLLVGTPAPAATRTQARFDDTRIFAPDDPPGSATTSLPGCATATTVDQRVQVAETPFKGIFIGIRDFQCGGDSGFVVRLQASFADTGSSGTWSIVDSYGDLAGLSGSGKLVGEPIEGGIIDHYSGWVTLR